MKTNVLVLPAAAIILTSLPRYAQATVIFSQDFSSAPTGPVSTYVNSTAPSGGQWNAIGTSGSGTTVAVTGGALAYTRSSGNAGSFARTDFSPVPAAVICRFNLNVSSTSAGTSAAQWLLGDSLTTGVTIDPAGNTHSKFGINFTGSSGIFSFRDVSHSIDSALFSGPQSVMWVVNNSGAALSYMAPDGSVGTVANDAWDLWAGSTLALNEMSATSSFQNLNDWKFVFNGGSSAALGTITMDNFQIEAVPESKHYGLISLSCLTGILAFQTFRSRRRNLPS